MSGRNYKPSVWAPCAQAVYLHASTVDTVHQQAMQRDGDGWWRTNLALPAGSDYGFAIDNGPVLPDPRSRWQPAGVHAMSRYFDTSEYDWQDVHWKGRDIRGAVIYELHVGTFTATGTLDSAIARLDELATLGVDVVELMPVAAFAGRHGWGYDGVCLYAVHEPYGGPRALQRFVDAAHARGLAVCLDVVYNHLGPSGNYLPMFGPYFTDHHETPWGQAINLDGPQSSEVREFIVNNARYWLQEFHIDALRLDAVHALKDDSPRHLLAELSDSVAELSATVQRPLSLIAESDLNDPAMVMPTEQGGLGMSAQWADDVHHAVHAFLTDERQGYYADFGSVSCLGKAFTRVFIHDGCYSSFRGSNWGKPVPLEMDAHRFVAFASDHDQVGNRAHGDRPSASLPAGKLAIAAAIILHSPCTPMLFMGEEWGASTPWQFFTDHAEPELADAIRNGRAQEFSSHGWDSTDTVSDADTATIPDPQARATFVRSRLNWEERFKEPHRQLLAWYKDLIALRHTDPEYAIGDLQSTSVDYDEQDHWLLFRRGSLWLAVAPLETPVVIPLAGSVNAELILAWHPEETSLHSSIDGNSSMHLPGFSAAFVRVPLHARRKISSS